MVTRYIYWRKKHSPNVWGGGGMALVPPSGHATVSKEFNITLPDL